MTLKIEVPPGSYIIAVSGGVDSMVLLDLLADKAETSRGDIRLVAAHFDHGIRPDSALDRQLVQDVAAARRLVFIHDEGKLGAEASEAAARKARYAFLNQVKQAAGADAIITAHHQDDVLETIIINWLRGTKSRGLSSLRSTADVMRPLLGVAKADIRAYAATRQLEWREDSTNEDEKYLRNYVRRQLMPRLDDRARRQLLARSERAAELNDAIGALTGGYLKQFTSPTSLDRAQYRELPEEVSREVLAEWLRRHTEVGITSKLLHRLDTAIRTGRNGSRVDIANGLSFELGREQVELAD